MATVFLLVEFLFKKGKIWQICKLYEKRIHHRCSPTESYKRPCDSFSRVYLDNSLKCLENNKETFSPLHFSATGGGYRYSMQRKHLVIFWVAENSKVLQLRFLWRPVYTYVSTGKKTIDFRLFLFSSSWQRKEKRDVRSTYHHCILYQPTLLKKFNMGGIKISLLKSRYFISYFCWRARLLRVVDL